MDTHLSSLWEVRIPMNDWEREIDAEVRVELAQHDPIKLRFNYHYFVSRSKGRGRKRQRWEEVELIADLDEPRRPSRYYSYHKFPWDTKATEALPHIDRDEAEGELRRRIVEP